MSRTHANRFLEKQYLHLNCVLSIVLGMLMYCTVTANSILLQDGVTSLSAPSSASLLGLNNHTDL